MALAAVAAVLVTFAGLAFLCAYRQLALERRQDRKDLDALYERQGELEAEQRATRAQVDEVANSNATAAIMAESAVYTAQRAEEKAIAAQAAVVVGSPADEPPPKRLA